MTLTQDTTPDPVSHKPRRARKPTDDQLAAQARTRIALAHAEPRYDLTVEAWIPVMRDGEVHTIGLHELLAGAHHISDLAIPHPLLRASMRRLLGALTADLVRRARTLTVDDWTDAHTDNVGFTLEQVDELLDVHGQHLWLWHPRTPFLQDQRLARDLMKPHVDQPAQELLLHLPTGSSFAWWVKASEPALQGGLSAPQTSMWLAARWFYAINGNCGDLRLPDGTTVGAHAGGSFAETVATVTHAFRVDGTSLFRSLLRGLPASMLESPVTSPGGDPAAASCAWLDDEQPRPDPDLLYRATLNAAAVLLTARADAGATSRFVRASTPVTGEVAKRLRNLALIVDHHRITAPTTKDPLHAVRVPPGALRGDVLQALHRAGFDGARLSGVVNSADCWLDVDAVTVDREHLDILLIGKGGTGSSPVWEDLAGVELPARHVDPSHPNPAVVEHVRSAVAIAFDPNHGVRQRLEWAVLDLLAQPGPDGWKPPKRDNTAARSLTEKAVNDWLVRTATALERVLDSDAPDALETWRAEVRSAARAAFDDVALPYITSTRYAPRYAVALRRLSYRRSA